MNAVVLGLFAGPIVFRDGRAFLELLDADPYPDHAEAPPWGPCLARHWSVALRLEYVPGFGGHRSRRTCACRASDERVCGRPHHDARESAAAVRARQETALLVSRREARDSANLGDVYGTGQARTLSVIAELHQTFETAVSLGKLVIARRLRETIIVLEEERSSYKRPSRSKPKSSPNREESTISSDERSEALRWIRRQPLRGSLQEHRTEVAAQAWIELHSPPPGSEALPFADKLRRSWERAKRAIRVENQTAWHCPEPSTDSEEQD